MYYGAVVTQYIYFVYDEEIVDTYATMIASALLAELYEPNEKDTINDN
jgi:hypothetical protein